MKVFGTEQPNGDQPPKVQLPDALKGKSPEAIYEALRQEHETVVNRIKAQKLDDLSKPQPTPAPTAPAPTTPQPQQPQAAPPSPNRYAPGVPGPISYRPQQETPNAFTDPEGFSQYQMDRRLGPLVQSTTQSLRGAHKGIFSQQLVDEDDKEIWTKHQDEIDRFMDVLSPELQANPNAYANAFAIVKSQYLGEIVDKKVSRKSTETLANTLADAGLDSETIAAIVAKAAGKAPAGQPRAADFEAPPSLFQPSTGVAPRVASANTGNSRQPVTPGRASKASAYSAEERKMMDEFEMTPEEWETEKAQNTDIFSRLKESL